MADDSKIAVELVAKVDQLQAGLAEAVSSLRAAVEAIKGDVHSLDDTAKESESILQKMFTMEAIDFAKEKIQEFTEVVKEAFESTIVKAEEFSLANAKFAAMMGTSETEAAGFSAVLRGVGSSAEQYESMALRMEMRLKTNEAAMQQYGITTRDANGQLLGGKDLMDSAIATMQTYKSGTDQNAFALEVFGRRAADVYDLMRVSNEDVEHQSELYRELGVSLEGTGSQAQEFEAGLNDLHTILDALEIKLGQQLMPVFEAGLNWLGHNGSELLKELEKTVEDLAGSLLQMTKDFMGVVEAAGKAYAWLDKMGELTDKLDDPRNEHAGETLKEIWGMFENIGQSADGASGHVDALTASWNSFKEAITGAISTGEYGPEADVIPQTNLRNPYKKSGGGRSFKAAGKGARDNSADEAIKDDEKLQLERVSAEESTNQHLLSMGQESVDAFVDQQRQLEDARYAIQSAALEKELALPNRTKAEKQKTNNEIALLEQTHVDALLKIDQDGETRRAAIAKEQLANFLKADDERLKSGIAALQEEAAVGQITLGERDAQEMALTQTIRQEQLARLDAELASLTPGTKAYEDVVKQRERVEKQFTADMKAENAQRAKDISANVSTWMTPITSGFKTAIKDMITSGKSFGDAMKQMGESMLSSFLDIILQMGERWAIMQVTNALIAQTTQSTLGVAQVTSNAAVAASGAAASQAAIPIVGPALAAGAAAETFALVMGTYSPLASAAGGMVLDRDRLVFAHNEEMILPATLSQGLQRMVAGGGGGGNINLHYNPQVSGGGKDLETLIREQPTVLRAHIAQLARDGAFRPRMT